MPIPVLISELSQTAASNYPQGSDSPATLDDTQRAHAGFIAQIRDGLPNAQNSTTQLITSVAGTNTITGSITPAITAYTAGQTFRFVAAGANTGAVTININGLGAQAITKSGATALAAGDIPSGAMVQIQYDGTQFQLSSASGGTDFLNTTRIDVASAGTVNLTSSAPSTRNINITGTTTITAFTVAIGQLYFVRFNAALTLTNNASIVTQTGASITAAAGDTCIFRATAANTVEVLGYVFAGAIPQARGGTGYTTATRQVAQVQTLQTGAVATGTTLIPNDDTIPQITEGDQYMTLAITPVNASSALVIQVVCQVTHTAGGLSGVALFQDSTANAIAAMSSFADAGQDRCIVFTHRMTAGTTSATTFRVRAGNSIAGTTTFNGRSSARAYGGVMASSIIITEFLP